MSTAGSDVILAVLMALVAGSGVAALVLAQPGRHDGKGWRLGISAVVFVLAVAATGSYAGVQWNAPTAVASAPNGSSAPSADLAQVTKLVAASNRILTVPTDLNPPLGVAESRPPSNFGGPPVDSGCVPAAAEVAARACVFGDKASGRTMVLFGDSHVQMWLQAINDIARLTHWRLVLLSKLDCPAVALATHAVGARGDNVPCEHFHSEAVRRINALHPDLLVISQEVYEGPYGKPYSPERWERGMEGLLKRVHVGRVVVLGNIPPSYGPGCLAHKTIRECSITRASRTAPFVEAEHRAATAEGDQFVDVTSWFCAQRCSPVIGTFDVYFDPSHVSVVYTKYLEGVLAQSFGLTA